MLRNWNGNLSAASGSPGWLAKLGPTRASVIEFLTKPSPQLRVFDFLKREVNCLAKKLSNALVGRALCAVMCYAPAKLRQHRLE